MVISAKKTSLTFYVPLDLKNRIEITAKADDRSTSSYLVRVLEKAVPQRETVLNAYEVAAINEGQVDLVEELAKRTGQLPELPDEHQASVTDDWDDEDRAKALKKEIRERKTSRLAKPNSRRRNTAKKRAARAK